PPLTLSHHPLPPRRSSDLSNVSFFTGATGLALPSVSRDGQYIAYLSNATNLTADTNSAANINVFFYDRGVDTNKLVSHQYQATRSEEHTSELQSHLNLVCR